MAHLKKEKTAKKAVEVPPKVVSGQSLALSKIE
jgi:hypothetical protein